jgi:hypothetical protein
VLYCSESKEDAFEKGDWVSVVCDDVWEFIIYILSLFLLFFCKQYKENLLVYCVYITHRFHTANKLLSPFKSVRSGSNPDMGAILPISLLVKHVRTQVKTAHFILFFHFVINEKI